jgi:hypothetical protein
MCCLRGEAATTKHAASRGALSGSCFVVPRRGLAGQALRCSRGASAMPIRFPLSPQGDSLQRRFR